MLFNHEPYNTESTIAALATPPGEGGIHVIRISGKEAFSCAKHVCRKDLSQIPSHRVLFSHMYSSTGEKIDDVLLLVMRAPKTFTGEDTVEIQCHGGRLIAQRILEELFVAGVRPAKPGEFSFKAFMNGKLDLSQAEAIQTLIGAKNENALRAANDLLDGKLSKKVRAFQASLTECAAILEAWVDFPEEDLEFISFPEIITRLEKTEESIEQLIATFHHGRMIQEGIQLAIIGAPNVGKSSLMNALLGKERAIVSAIPGTTRDTIEEELRIAGLHIRLADTAGIRATTEHIELEGIRRTKIALDKADLIFFVLDASEPVVSEELVHLAQQKKSIAIWNKMDIAHTKELPKTGFEHVVPISCKTGEGLDLLQKTVQELLFCGSMPDTGEVMITSLRHKEALVQAKTFLHQVIEGLKNHVSPEFLAFDMRMSLHSLGTIIGVDVTEDILTSIFSQFCIGK